MKINYVVLKIFIILFILTSCSGPDARKVPVNADERVKKNIEEGRGLRLSTSLGGNTNFSFASSNPLWRATLEKLDFMPLNNVDYAGGVIITDWYNDIDGSDQEIKIAVRFLTNEIRSDALNITLFKRECLTINNCKTSVLKNNINNEIKSSILKRAAQISQENETTKKK